MTPPFKPYTSAAATAPQGSRSRAVPAGTFLQRRGARKGWRRPGVRSTFPARISGVAIDTAPICGSAASGNPPRNQGSHGKSPIRIVRGEGFKLVEHKIPVSETQAVWVAHEGQGEREDDQPQCPGHPACTRGRPGVHAESCLRGPRVSRLDLPEAIEGQAEERKKQSVDHRSAQGVRNAEKDCRGYLRCQRPEKDCHGDHEQENQRAVRRGVEPWLHVAIDRFDFLPVFQAQHLFPGAHGGSMGGDCSVSLARS